MFSLITLIAALLLLIAHASANPNSITTTAVTTTLPIKTITISPVPLAAAEIPRCLSKNDLLAAHYRDYIPLCNVDIPSSLDIFPFLWVGSFEACLGWCDSFNFAAANDVLHGPKLKDVKREVQGMLRGGAEVRCKAALFAPGRWLGEDDCYLKYGLEGAKKTEGKIWLVGGIKREDLENGDGGRLSFNGTTMQEQTGAPSETKTTKSTDKIESETTSKTGAASTATTSAAASSTAARSTPTPQTSTSYSSQETAISTSTSARSSASSSSTSLFDPTLPPILTLSTAYNEKHSWST